MSPEERNADREARRAAWIAQHEADLEARRLARAAEREQKRASWKDMHPSTYETEDEKFAREQAARLGITVDEFRDLQAARRNAMADKPSISYSPTHEVH